MLKREVDLHVANGRQRKALRVAIQKTFHARDLERFLDEELNIKYQSIVAVDNADNMVWELIGALVRRGKLNIFVDRWIESEEFGSAPTLRSVLETWTTLAEEEPVRTGSEQVRQTVDEPVVPYRSAAGDISAVPVTPRLTEDERQRGRVEAILEGRVGGIAADKWLEGLAALTHQVCAIEADHVRGTGFLVGPRHVMTTAYMIQGLGSELHQMTAIFSDARSERQSIAMARILSIDPESIAEKKVGAERIFESLDFALLELTADVPTVEGRSRGWFDLGDRRSRLHPGEAVTTLSNILGTGLAMSQGSLAYPPGIEGRFAHDAETEPGSGGAPIFDSRLRLIGIHEGRFGGRQGPKEVNIAIRADAIARELWARGIRLPTPGTDD